MKKIFKKHNAFSFYVHLLVCLFLSLLNFSCSTEENIVSPDDLVSKELIGKWVLIDYESEYTLHRDSNEYLISELYTESTNKIEFLESPKVIQSEGYVKFESKQYKVTASGNVLVHQTYFSLADILYYSNAKWYVEEGQVIIKPTNVDSEESMISINVNMLNNTLTIMVTESILDEGFQGTTIFKYQRE
ncbi:hypothetical protein [Flavivirga sp. 57AJ16]|uniref:hypothetical protein n=1 Tax=Flavivirga sp. 57AJ16 TaxID=3025307 RepID=UPI0023651ACB|nr:hypothetical protein [Flavivirga sp. 57AJ16]MDD7886213.1 hypothetical protein [Flavivirga sp. 57AJ16]